MNFVSPPLQTAEDKKINLRKFLNKGAVIKAIKKDGRDVS
jgi:hypothetical protein